MNTAHEKLHWHPSRKPTKPVPNCPMPEWDADDVPPVIGEKFVDVLAERAIATLADHQDNADA